MLMDYLHPKQTTFFCVRLIITKSKKINHFTDICYDFMDIRNTNIVLLMGTCCFYYAIRR